MQILSKPTSLFCLAIFLGLLTVGLLLGGCYKEPEGPAERIGRGIDEIAQGLREIDKERSTYYPTPTPTPSPTPRYPYQDRYSKDRYNGRYDSRDDWNRERYDY